MTHQLLVPHIPFKSNDPVPMFNDSLTGASILRQSIVISFMKHSLSSLRTNELQSGPPCMDGTHKAADQLEVVTESNHFMQIYDARNTNGCTNEF